MKKLIALVGGCLAATVRAAAFLACLSLAASVRAQGWVQPMTSASVVRRGAGAFDPLDDLLHLERLPLSRGGTYVRYEGSIDKRGLNDDQNWYAHPCGTNEWIVFEHRGPGCIQNLTKHAFLGGEGECTYRFYFDGATTPGLTLSTADIGRRYPALEPFGGAFVTADIDGPPGGFHIVRCFAPIPFARSCRITTDRECSKSAWGHVICQCYYDGRTVRTYDPKDGAYIRLGRRLRQLGRNPIAMTNAAKTVATDFTLARGESRTVYADDASGLVAGIEVVTRDFDRADLSNLVVRAWWNGARQPDLDVPFGSLFANELGYGQVRTLLSGMGADGSYYDFHPMPYARGARIDFVNAGARAVRFDRVAVTRTREFDALYAARPCGVFRGRYLPPTPTRDLCDTVFAEVRGCGHVVGSTITTRHVRRRSHGSIWEGDARIHLDGLRTPSVESDGSESYSSYGWGYWDPPQSNPWSSYDCHEVRGRDWSMARHLIGDAYPFSGSFRFGFEHGPENRFPLLPCGAVFWYGFDGLDWRELEASRSPSAADPVSLTSVFEGELAFRSPLTLRGRYGAATELRFTVPERTVRVIVRRVSDQRLPRQLARVSVNGRELADLPWFVQDCNPYHRWLEDDYPVAARNLRPGEVNVIRIEPQPCDGVTSFNDFGYRVFAVVDTVSLPR